VLLTAQTGLRRLPWPALDWRHWPSSRLDVSCKVFLVFPAPTYTVKENVPTAVITVVLSVVSTLRSPDYQRRPSRAVANRDFNPVSGKPHYRARRTPAGRSRAARQRHAVDGDRRVRPRPGLPPSHASSRAPTRHLVIHDERLPCRLQGRQRLHPPASISPRAWPSSSVASATSLAGTSRSLRHRRWVPPRAKAPHATTLHQRQP